MRNDWKWNWDWNKGPQGPMGGRRMRRRPLGGGLLGLFGLLIGIRVILPVIGIAGVVALSVLGSLAAAFSGVISAIGSVFSGLFGIWGRAAGGLAAGIAIGLIAHRMIRAKKEKEATPQEEEKEAEAQEAYDSAETRSIQNYYG